MRNHGIFVTNEIWVLVSGQCTLCWTSENLRVDAWKMSDDDSSRSKKTKGPQYHEGGMLSIL